MDTMLLFKIITLDTTQKYSPAENKMMLTKVKQTINEYLFDSNQEKIKEINCFNTLLYENKLYKKLLDSFPN